MIPSEVRRDLEALLKISYYKKILICDRNEPIYIEITKIHVTTTPLRVTVWRNKTPIATAYLDRIWVRTNVLLGCVDDLAVVTLTPDIWRIQAFKNGSIAFDHEY